MVSQTDGDIAEETSGYHVELHEKRGKFARMLLERASRFMDNASIYAGELLSVLRHR